MISRDHGINDVGNMLATRYRLKDIREYTGRNLDEPAIILQKECNDGSRVYCAFDSYESLRDWYVELEPEERTYHEVIMDGPQKFRLDLESIDSSISKTLWNEMVCNIIDVTCNLMKSSRYLRYRSEHVSESKRSEHIVFLGKYMEGSNSCNMMIADVLHELDKLSAAMACRLRDQSILYPYRSIIDTGVYKKVQHMRLEGSHKVGSKRYKYLLGQDDVSDRFLESFISNIPPHYIHHIPRSKTPLPIDKRNNISSTVRSYTDDL